jgi:hypothetical protein
MTGSSLLKLVVLLLLVALGGVSACGDDSKTATKARTSHAGESTGTGRPGPGHRAADYLGTYDEARSVCAIGSRRRVAANVRSTSTRPKAIARALAAGYQQPRRRRQAYEGCLAALK